MSGPARLTSGQVLFAVFFFQALSGGGLFARLPDLQRQAVLSESALGLALALAAAGGLISTPFSASLVARFGTRAILALCLPLITLSNVAAGLAGGFTSLLFGLVAGAVAFSVSNVAMNIEADRIEVAAGGRIMNRCHGYWSLGMLAASVLGVGARAGGVTPFWHFMTILPVLGLVAVTLATGMRPAPKRGSTGGRRTGIALPDRATMLVVLFGLSASVAQGGTQNWSVLFMAQNFVAPAWIDTLTLPAFLITLAVGRLYADAWVVRFGPVTLARILALLALAGGACVVLSPALWVALLGFSMLGLGTAAVFPLAISAAARLPHQSPEDSVSAVILTTGLLMLAAPAAMGWVAEEFGLRMAFAGILPLFLVTLALAGRAGGDP